MHEPSGARPDAATPTPAARRAPLLINREFALLWSGQVVTDLGTVVFNTTLVIWVGGLLAAGQSWAPLAVGGVLVAQSLPQIVLRPLAGVFVDRADTRRTMLRMDALRAVLIVALMAAMRSGALPTLAQLGGVYLAVLLVSAATQFFNPALFTLIGDLAPEPHRARASGLSEITWNVASVVGPPLAAPLVLWLGVEWALALNAASFVVSFLTIRAIHPLSLSPSSAGSETSAGETEPAGRMLAELREGVGFVARNPVVRTVTIAIGIAMLGAGTLHTLEFFFVTENLHAAPALYGLVGAAFGAGSVLGDVLAAWLVPRIGLARGFALSMLGVGLALMVLARETSLAPALGIYVLFGVVNSGANVALVPLLLNTTPRRLTGRVNALFFTSISVASLAASALSGWLASALPHKLRVTVLALTFGPIDTLLVLAGLAVCAGGVYAAARLR